MTTSYINKYLLLVWAISMPLDVIQGPYGLSFGDISSAVLLSATIYHILIANQIKKRVFYILLLSLLLLISMNIGSEGFFSNEFILVSVKIVSCLFIGAYWSARSRYVWWVVAGLMIGSSVCVLFAVLQGIVGLDHGIFVQSRMYTSRSLAMGLPFKMAPSTGIIASNGVFGTTAATFALTLGALYKKSDRENIFPGGALFVIGVTFILATILSQSRSGLLAYTVVFLLIILLKISYSETKALYLLAGSAFLMTLALLLYKSLYISPETIASRLKVIKLAFAEFNRHYLIGLGFDNMAGKLGSNWVVHNTFVTALVFGGTFALMSIVIIWSLPFIFFFNIDTFTKGLYKLYHYLLLLHVASTIESLAYNGIASTLHYVIIGVLVGIGTRK